MGLAHLASGRRNDALGAYTARYAGIELVNSQTAGPRVTTIRAGRVAAPSLSSRALPPSAVAPPAASPRTRDAVNAADGMHSIDTRRVHLDAVVVIPKDDFPKVALKHLQDAQALLKSNRFDGAAYLAGYVVECALKTMIESREKECSTYSRFEPTPVAITSPGSCGGIPHRAPVCRYHASYQPDTLLDTGDALS